MDTRISKRSYTDTALEFWFGCVANNWEKRFTAEELTLGRKIYRKGGVRALELSAEDAIVSIRWEDRDAYVVLDYPRQKLEFRASTEDSGQARVMAVAGLYEIEELVGDEIPPLPVPPATADNAVQASAEPVAEDPPAKPRAPRLQLDFKLVAKGLCFTIWGRDSVKGTQTRLFDGHAGEMIPPSLAGAREALIALMAMAKRAGFRFRKQHGDFILEDLDRLPGFARNDLKKWRQHFTLQSNGCLEALAKGTRELTLHTRGKAAGATGLHMDWTLGLGQRMLDPGEAGQVLRHSGRSTLLPGHGLVRLQPDAARFFNELREHPDYRQGTPLPRYMLYSLFARNSGQMTMEPELARWKDSLSRKPAAASTGTDTAPLRSYQRLGLDWLRHLHEHNCHGLLADEMGLGKTLQLLAFLATAKAAETPALVVCPASVVPVWFAEAKKFFPALRLQAATKNALPGARDQVEPDLWISSYTQLRRNRAVFEQVNFHTIILDEAQFIKNPDAKVTQACLVLKGTSRFALTGTPLENRYLDIWTLFRFLMPGLLGSRGRFQERLQNDSGELARALKSQIAPFILRRTKDAVVRELPEKVESDLICPLSGLQTHEYQRLARAGLARLGSDLQDTLSGQTMGLLTLLTRLRQVCCDPALLPWIDAPTAQSGKLNVLESRLGELLAAGHKAVVFSQYVTLLNRVRHMLGDQAGDYPVFELTGHTLDRANPVAAFQKQSGAAVFLASLKAGGSGITLHAADYVFLLDPWWNPAVEAQAVDRVHRIGQKKTVFVYRMLTRGTIEEKIRSLQADKRGLFDHLFKRLGQVADLPAHFKNLAELIELRDS